MPFRSTGSQEIAYPLVWLLQVSANLVLRVLRVKPAPAGMIAYTREDIRHSVAAAEDVGELHEAEEEMLYKVFDFASKEVVAVMVPRPEVVAISVDMTPEDALATVVDSPYTRYPVFRDSLDEIVGVLHVRDLFAAIHDLGIASVQLESIVRACVRRPGDQGPRRAPRRLPAREAAHGDRRRRVRRDGGHRHARGPPRGDRRRDRGRVRPPGHVCRARSTRRTSGSTGTYTIDDFNEAFGTELEEGDYHTMAGLVFGALGRQPEVGDGVQVDGLRLEVLEVEGSRIGRIEVEFGSDETPAGAPEAA